MHFLSVKKFQERNKFCQKIKQRRRIEMSQVLCLVVIAIMIMLVLDFIFNGNKNSKSKRRVSCAHCNPSKVLRCYVRSSWNCYLYKMECVVALIKILDDAFSIVKRIKALNRGYFIVYNTTMHRYEVHNSFQRSTFCITCDTGLNATVITKLRKTKIENIIILWAK